MTMSLSVWVCLCVVILFSGHIQWYKKVSRLFQGRLTTVSRWFSVGFKGKRSEGNFREGSNVFQGCFKEVSREGVPRKFLGCFKEVSRVFQESFIGVSMEF